MNNPKPAADTTPGSWGQQSEGVAALLSRLKWPDNPARRTWRRTCLPWCFDQKGSRPVEKPQSLFTPHSQAFFYLVWVYGRPYKGRGNMGRTGGSAVGAPTEERGCSPAPRAAPRGECAGTETPAWEPAWSAVSSPVRSLSYFTFLERTALTRRPFWSGRAGNAGDSGWPSSLLWQLLNSKVREFSGRENAWNHLG